MPSTRETILATLHARLSNLPATMLRNASLPERIPAEGLLILRDGQSGEPEVTLSPLRYHWQHRAELEVFLRGGLDALFDTLLAEIGAILATDRTLGGLRDWIEPSAPEPVYLAVDGAAPIRAAILTLTLHYTSADPLA
ncbi:MAG: acyl-CoA transferase [Paracoccus sp. (in: a-proteobacteria)]|uniref:acyl-CoA transferase n=1 Tax=Paracoccus sp. TaxID=267 RepID=UPI0026E01C55|nr:acyl-CoA transferase [Paracoccus sp. (in: a-proteobacteria)]MDO5633194.1 acyl-CoA transferase [Paracoccus sp. (in: a-proteobacteria)]